MPTRKQRKRLQKERRHEYETVWVDSEGNELEEPPDDVPAPTREKRPPGKPTQEPKRQQRGRAPARIPQPPSWRRAIRRSLILGAVILAFMGFAAKSLAAGAFFAVIYTGLFIPFTFYLDRFVYRRWQRNASAHAKKR